MKIIFLLPSLTAGGAERVVSILSKEFLSQGLSVEIALMYDNIVHYEIPPAVTVTALNTSSYSKLNRIKKIIHYLRSAKKNDKITVIPFQDNCLKYALIASAFVNVPVIATERNNPYIKGNGFWARFKAAIPFMFSKQCVFQTVEARKYYNLLPDKKCSVIINPITLVEQKWKKNLSESDMIMVCRLHKQKNIPMLIDAMSIIIDKFPNAKVSIYGAGSLLGDLEQYAKEKQMNTCVLFKGITNNIHEKLSESSIFLLTSDYEGMSNAMLEAMSVGMPLICTDCPIGGANYMLKDGSGILTLVGNAEFFAKSVINLLEHPQTMLMLGEKAYNKARQFSPTNIAKQWLSILNKTGKKHK